MIVEMKARPDQRHATVQRALFYLVFIMTIYILCQCFFYLPISLVLTECEYWNSHVC